MNFSDDERHKSLKSVVIKIATPFDSLLLADELSLSVSLSLSLSVSLWWCDELSILDDELESRQLYIR